MTGYAVSSQSSFTCKPCSIRHKRVGQLRARRLTYAATTDPKPRIQCFIESSSANARREVQISSLAYEIKDASSPVIHLEAVGGDVDVTGASTTALIVVHEDGEIRCFSEDLSAETWRCRAVPKRSEEEEQQDIRVTCAAVIGVGQARQGILKNREDVLALLDASADPEMPGAPIANLLLLVTRLTRTPTTDMTNTLQFRVFSIATAQQPSKSFVSSSATKPLEELITATVPEPADLQSKECRFSCHELSGMLYQQSGESLAIYSVNGTSPCLEQHLRVGHEITSYLRISGSSIAATSQSSVSIFDTRYHSVRASRALETGRQVSSTAGEVEKRHRSPPTSVKLVSYFALLDAVIAVQGRNLLSFQVSQSTINGASHRKRTRDGSLIDSVGRGIALSNPASSPSHLMSSIPKALGVFLPSRRVSDNWEKEKAKLGHYVLEGKLEEFERLVLEELGITSKAEARASDINTDPAGKPIEASRSERAQRDWNKVSYVLSKIFSPATSKTSAHTADDEDVALKINFLHSPIFRWLVNESYLSTPRVELSLKCAGLLAPTAALQSAAIVSALAAFDPSLSLLEHMLRSTNYLTPREIIPAIRLAIELLRRDDNMDYVKQIANGEDHGDETDFGLQLPNGNDSATTEAKNLDSHAAHQVLRAASARLIGHHATDIIRALKQDLSQHDMIFVIDYLRLTLAKGGWLSRYIDHSSLTQEDQPESNKQIYIASQLLNYIVDSLGSGGWIIGSAGFMQHGDTITHMRAEISAALEGVQEAAYLKEFLGEVLLYSKTALPLSREKTTLQYDQGRTETTLQTQTQTQTRKAGVVKPITIPFKDAEANPLPLGLKASQDIPLTKVGAGGEIQKRSMRDIGRLKSQRVGKYSFERIMI